jgi:hypothetical protein
MYLQKVLDIAKKEICYQEKPGNNNKFGAFFKANYQPWCYYFISYCMITAGMNIPPCGSCPVGFIWYAKRGKITHKPEVGALAFMCWNKAIFYEYDKSVGIPQHIEIVVQVNKNGTFYTIGGNTSPDNKFGSQDNGDGVYRKLRKLSDVKGFGIPNYGPNNIK